MKNVKNKMLMRAKRAFTLVEIITAVGIMVMVVGFTSVIFKTSIEGYRTSVANGEIMQKLQTITTQLNRDFQNLPKDGYLAINKELYARRETINANQNMTVHLDSIYYFTEGDFQSWFNPNVRSNIARVYFGPDEGTISNDVVLSKCRIVRDTMLLTPVIKLGDANNISYSQIMTSADPFSGFVVLDSSISVSDPNASASLDKVRIRMCEGVGELKIQWLKGITQSLEWSGESESGVWNPYSSDWPKDWPEALKFTFTLYDSKGILKGGRTFTYIVYIGD